MVNNLDIKKLSIMELQAVMLNNTPNGLFYSQGEDCFIALKNIDICHTQIFYDEKLCLAWLSGEIEI